MGCLEWHHVRFLGSRLFRLATWEVQGMARALVDIAWTERPVGTLPDDDDELAHLLRVGPDRLRELRRMDLGPLRGWRPYIVGGGLRLSHPVIVEQVARVLAARHMQRGAV
ncbi:MAG TPA: hypothetical protein PKD10_16150 [Paracoccaceae bacterium]|nr:hypothetical protein [Paracoccaceae bacterium]HMO73682.1 hypothetical protein [Paracoccaceae bacterium]